MYEEISNEEFIMKNDALDIIKHAIAAADPFDATKAILEKIKAEPIVNPVIISVGKAAVPMAHAAEVVFDGIKHGLLVTKYDHIGEYKSDAFEMIEAAHPVSDNNSISAAERALQIADDLTEEDVLIVLLSGGGSALMEKSIVSPDIQRDITKKLLARGTEINEINAVRRRISLIKGGRLAAKAYPARVITVALSDVLNNDKSVIASGITVKEPLSVDEFNAIAEKYLPEYTGLFADIIKTDAELKINDGGYYFAGDINSLCDDAEKRAKELGYNIADTCRCLTGEASDTAVRLIDNALRKHGKNAFIYGGETTVTLHGDGLGGRNQEMTLAASIRLKDTDNIVFASVGSDGTDGPTDAAGAVADGKTYSQMVSAGINPEKELENNNSYYALKSVGALVVTGPTGTNVNDLTVILAINNNS